MKRRTKNMLRALAKHFGLKIVFVSYFPTDVYGKLIPREKRILVNAFQPRCEHIFTVLHEIGHYIRHVLNPCQTRHPRIFDINWKMKFLADRSSLARRSFRFAFNNSKGKEWEADIWAMCAFIYLAKTIGCKSEFMAFLKRHPEKLNVFLLAACGTIYCGVKASVKNLWPRLLVPFDAAFR